MAIASPLSVLPTMPRDLARLEERLGQAVVAEHDYLTEIASHLIAAGGKRVRPGFTIAAGGTRHTEAHEASENVLMGGVAVELVHIGSLYHDDVMDEARIRRNAPSVNARWDNLKAILAGDFLLARASGIAASLGTEVAGLLAATISELCEGQILELRDTYNVDRRHKDYERSIAGKTASLLATACRVGGIVGEIPRSDIEALTEFGHAYGMAFQIVDDILDVIATDDQLGKPAGNDLLEGVYTLPVLLAIQTDVGEELRSILGGELTMDQRDRARELVRYSTGVDEALDEARCWADKAGAVLTALPDSAATDAFLAAADHLIRRAADPLG
ncbi:MAG: polyprenyl synthetase family protein [Acidimicrobiales bacterium]